MLAYLEVGFPQVSSLNDIGQTHEVKETEECARSVEVNRLINTDRHRLPFGQV